MIGTIWYDNSDKPIHHKILAGKRVAIKKLPEETPPEVCVVNPEMIRGLSEEEIQAIEKQVGLKIKANIRITRNQFHIGVE